jgi:hypothetical protein
MTKLDWSKADAEAGAGARDNSRAAMLRRTATAEYLARHDLAWLRCGT